MDDNFIDFEELSKYDYIIVLLDMLLYKHSELVNTSMDLLNMHFSQNANLLENLKCIQLIEDPAIEQSLMKIRSYNTKLDSLGAQCEEWYYKADKVGQPDHEYAKSFLKIATELSDCCTCIINKDMGERVHEWAQEENGEMAEIAQ
jgi:hypothetical protein